MYIQGTINQASQNVPQTSHTEADRRYFVPMAKNALLCFYFLPGKVNSSRWSSEPSQQQQQHSSGSTNGDRGINMNWSALHHAAFDGSMRLTRAMLVRGCSDIDRRTGDGLGFPALALAAQEGHYDVVKLLLQNGARQSARSDGGCTALIMSAIHGHARVAQLLIDSGADVDASDCNGVTSVYSAALKGYPKVVKLLIEAGAGVNICASDGSMPLHPSSKGGHLAVVKLLVEAGARLDVRNGDGGAPMHMAADQGYRGWLKRCSREVRIPTVACPAGRLLCSKPLSRDTPTSSSCS